MSRPSVGRLGLDAVPSVNSQDVGNLSPEGTASRTRKPESSKFLLCKFQRILKDDWMQRAAARPRMNETLTQTLGCGLPYPQFAAHSGTVPRSVEAQVRRKEVNTLNTGL